MKRNPFSQSLCRLVVAMATWSLLSSVHSTEPVRKEITLGFESPKVVQFGDVAITQQDVMTHLENLQADESSELFSDPELLAGVLSTIYLSQAFLERVQDAGLLDDAELNARIYSSLARELRSLYRSWYLSNEELDDYSSLAREIYLTNQDRFRSPRTVDMEHVVLRVPSSDDEVEVMGRVVDLHQQITAGATFAEVHSSLSESERQQSGEYRLEGIATSDLLPQIGALLGRVKPGEIGPPVRTQVGWHVIRLVEVHEGQRLSWEDAEDQAIRMAKERHRTLTWERYLRDLQDQPYEFPEGSIDSLRTRFGITDAAGEDAIREIELYLRDEPPND